MDSLQYGGSPFLSSKTASLGPLEMLRVSWCAVRQPAPEVGLGSSRLTNSNPANWYF
jgi:hypothetical protein